MRGIAETAIMTAALLTATIWSAGPAAATVDGVVGGLAGNGRASVTSARLPLGDGNVSTSATAGSVWACQTRFNGGGAFTDGPWITGDGTYDYTAKAVVDGDVSWPSQFTISQTGSTRTLLGNGLPSHTTGVYPIGQSDDAYRYDRHPNSIKEQSLELSLPATPTLASQPSCLPGGPIGVLRSGSVFFNALDALGRDAVAHEAQDRCQGHPQQNGQYHYHNMTACLQDDGGGHSPLMGYAFDGFGIFGHHGEGGTELTNADLDACHGHTHTITWDGQSLELYHYHATQEYPYTLGCFRGTPNRQAMAAPGGPGAGSNQGAGGPGVGAPGPGGPSAGAPNAGGTGQFGAPSPSGGSGMGGPGRPPEEGPAGAGRGAFGPGQPQRGGGDGQPLPPQSPPPGGSQGAGPGAPPADGQEPPPPLQGVGPQGAGPQGMRGGPGAARFGPPPPPR